MIVNHNAPDEDEVSAAPDHQELRRQLLEQFYKDSVNRYGDHSETAHRFSMMLKEVGPQRTRP